MFLLPLEEQIRSGRLRYNASVPAYEFIWLTRTRVAADEWAALNNSQLRFLNIRQLRSC